MMLKKDKGITLIELIIVIALITVIGGTLMTILDVGGNHYKKANENFDNQSEARTAMAFITTTLRQNDISGGVTVLGKTRLIIRNSSGTPIKIISFNSANKELEFTDGVLKVIAKIDEVIFEQIGNNINITINYGNDKHLNSTITLRSE